MSGAVVSLALYRAKKGASAEASPSIPPAWQHDITTCCAYANMLKTRHAAESADIHFTVATRGLRSWSEAEDLSERTSANCDEWWVYRGVIAHLAALPATTRREAELKRYAIGRTWLRAEGEWSERLHAGCFQDNHLFPPSERLKQRATKGDA